jgi:hypothetical protein
MVFRERWREVWDRAADWSGVKVIADILLLLEGVVGGANSIRKKGENSKVKN